MYMVPFNDFWEDFENPIDRFFDRFDLSKNLKSLAAVSAGMPKTDIKETDTNYEIKTDLPGVKKENIEVSLDNGYLNITASTKSESDEKDDNGNYIRRERSTGTYSRRFKVDESLTEKDIKADFKDGVLTLVYPKPQKQLESQKKVISKKRKHRSQFR